MKLLIKSDSNEIFNFTANLRFTVLLPTVTSLSSVVLYHVYQLSLTHWAVFVLANHCKFDLIGRVIGSHYGSYS